jgi:signal transduction histidine kinase
MSQLDARRLVLTRTATSTQELIAEVVAGQEQACAARSLELRQCFAGKLPDLQIDRARVLQVFENLVGNALKFTETGSITLGAKPGEQNVLFWVSDTGAGISEEDQNRLFDRFWQAKAKRKAGAGLGLAIAKGIVEGPGERLWVESEIGKGTTYWHHLLLHIAGRRSSGSRRRLAPCARTFRRGRRRDPRCHTPR